MEKVHNSCGSQYFKVVQGGSKWSNAHNACSSQYFKVVSDPNDGCPHLVKAARQGTTALVDFLLETGADLEESDRLKCKPIYIANMHLFHRFGNTALMAAASNGHLQVVQRLIRVGANVAASCKVGS